MCGRLRSKLPVRTTHRHRLARAQRSGIHTHTHSFQLACDCARKCHGLASDTYIECFNIIINKPNYLFVIIFVFLHASLLSRLSSINYDVRSDRRRVAKQRRKKIKIETKKITINTNDRNWVIHEMYIFLIKSIKRFCARCPSRALLVGHCA